MLLRRVTQHIKDQNWFAVWLDFVIVVIGVFIGLQTSNWNDAREQNRQAAVYTDRLSNDLQIEFEYATSLIEYYRVTHQAGLIAYDGLSAEMALDDETVLINAFRASQYNWYERRRAAFDEIVASGSLALIDDVALRETAIGIYNTPVFSLLESEGASSRYRERFRMAIDPRLHENLLRNCGDVEYDNGGEAVALVEIGYACKLDVSKDDIAEAIAALRRDIELFPALRLRNAQVSGQIIDMEIFLRTHGLVARFGS
ncbi:MAG: DUF6090 family protein [Hyphomonas sp.]|jgi:hypothetical protein|nr:hypothetical protein [Henriciella sp.]MBO6697005.1 hypothetical protein [Henriciella sp.]MCR9225635.1 DUF6090 family protein [Hyphomonas sp.]